MTAKLKEDLILSFNKFIENNKSLNKKELISIINDIYKKNSDTKIKKPLSAYQIFMKKNYSIIQEQEKLKGDIKPGQIMAEIGKLWKLKKENEGILSNTNKKKSKIDKIQENKEIEEIEENKEIEEIEENKEIEEIEEIEENKEIEEIEEIKEIEENKKKIKDKKKINKNKN